MRRRSVPAAEGMGDAQLLSGESEQGHLPENSCSSGSWGYDFEGNERVVGQPYQKASQGAGRKQLQYQDCAAVPDTEWRCRYEEKEERKPKREKAENEAENGRKGKNVRYTPSGVLRRVILIFAALYLAGMGDIPLLSYSRNSGRITRGILGISADLVKLSMSEEIRDATAQGKEITSGVVCGQAGVFSWRFAALILM